MSELDDLKATVERLRAAHFPQLPPELVRDILEVEVGHVEERGPAPRKVEIIIDEFLEND